MSTFTIDPDNNITALVELPADADRSNTFSTEKELARLIADWPISRLIDAWRLPFEGVGDLLVARIVALNRARVGVVMSR